MDVFYAEQKDLMETLLERFPPYVHKGYDGTVTAFIVEDREDNPKVQQVLSHIQSLGYEFESRPKDLSKKVHLQRTIFYEESDCDRADFVRAMRIKYSKVGAMGFIRNGHQRYDVRWIYFGQRLYQYWKKNLGDMTWYPLFLSEL